MVEDERIELSISGCKPDVFPLALIPHKIVRISSSHLDKMHYRFDHVNLELTFFSTVEYMCKPVKPYSCIN